MMMLIFLGTLWWGCHDDMLAFFFSLFFLFFFFLDNIMKNLLYLEVMVLILLVFLSETFSMLLSSGSMMTVLVMGVVEAILGLGLLISLSRYTGLEMKKM